MTNSSSESIKSSRVTARTPFCGV